MGVPLSQVLAVTTHVVRNALSRRRRYPLVLMLEPLFRCNLACAGCGKIQYPAHVLRRHLSLEQCLAAADECGAPVVSIAGGEPLMHPEMEAIVAGLVARRRYVYLCTNAVLLERALEAGRFTPSRYLSFSIHLDGGRDDHDFAVCREGTFEKAVAAIRKAVAAGFRVTTNTTLFDGADPERVRAFFDEAMALGVEGMMVSPGYSYQAAPDQEHFLRRERTQGLFRAILNGNGTAARGNGRRRWRFNQSPLFLQFLQGKVDLECTPWGNPTYNVFGWQRPCYLLQEGYASSFQQLLDETEWHRYGRASGNPRCADCMVHCGYEATAVHQSLTSVRGMWRSARAVIDA